VRVADLPAGRHRAQDGSIGGRLLQRIIVICLVPRRVVVIVLRVVLI